MIRIKFLDDVQPGYAKGGLYDVDDSFAHLMVTTRKATYAGLQPVPLDGDGARRGGRGLSPGGLRVCYIGASTEMRACPYWVVNAANYSRSNGIATAVLNHTLKDQYFLPGHKVRLCAENRPDIEGAFELLSSVTTPGVSCTVSWPDPRPDVPSGVLDSNCELHDLHGWTVTAGYPAFANLALGGALDIVVVATGSTNINAHWLDDRVRQVADQGQFDVIVIGTGLAGNAIKGGGMAANAIYAGMVRLIERLRRLCRPRAILVETMTVSRDVGPTHWNFTTGTRLNEMLWNQLPRDCEDVVVIPCGEALIQNYSAYNAAPPADVSNGWCEQGVLLADGVHHAYGFTRVRGIAHGDALLRVLSRVVSPEMAILPATRQVANTVDPEGNYVPNQALGLWGNVAANQATLAGSGVSGVGPAGSQVVFEASRGSSTAVGALRTNPNGGTDWVVTVNGLGSSNGYTLAVEHAPSWLLTALNSATNQRRYVDIILPVTVQLNAGKISWVSIELVATVDGVEYILGAAQAQQGLYTMTNRQMDAGYSGNMRFPRFKLPAATYTDARFRIRVKEVSGSVVSGQTVVVMGPGQTFKTLEG